MFDEYSDILNIEDVMTALMVGRGRVYQMLNNQELHGFRIGNTWKVSKEALIEYVRKNTYAQPN